MSIAKLGLARHAPAGSSGSGTVTHTGALTADLPVVGNGTDDIKVGTKSGTGTQFPTTASPTIASPVFSASIQISAGAEPAAGVGNRGMVILTAGGAGVADSFRVCVKLDDDSYDWVPLF